MREGWEEKPLKDVCVIKPPKKEVLSHLEESDPVSFIPMNDLGIDSKYFTSREQKLLAKAYKSYTYFREGDVVLAKITPCFENGKLGIAKDLINEVGFGSSEFIVYRPLENLNNEYLYYFLNQASFRKEGQAVMTGAVGHKRIPKDFYEEYKIPIPPLPEQRRIVAILDEAFEALDQAKANVERNLANARELFQSKLNQVFSQRGEGWEEKRLIDVNRFIDYRGRTPRKTESGIRLITAKNVRMGYLKKDPEEFIAVEDYDDWMTRGIPRKGDVLFTTEAPLANVALLDTDEKIALAQRIITFSPNRERLLGEYLTYCIQSKEMQDKIIGRGTGATVTGIKSRLLKEITIPIPVLAKQNEIVTQLNKFKVGIESIVDSYETKQIGLIELKKSLLQKAFTGELTAKLSESELAELED